MDYLYTKLLTKDLAQSQRFVRDVLGGRIVRQQDQCFECDLFGQLIVFECLSMQDTLQSKVSHQVPVVVNERYQLDVLYERCLSHDVEILKEPAKALDAESSFFNLIIFDPMGYTMEFKYYTFQFQGVEG
ncbi:MAG TPA: VOC family protein [Gammaproteobacteria bacterium]|nr:VOC family protein [Gammaproteobacteria bacterium]